MGKQYGKSATITTIAFAVIFVVIGLPLWWKTTEVYRYPVPHHDCQKLATTKVTHTVLVKLVIADLQVQQGVLWEELLQISQRTQLDHVSAVTFEWSMNMVNEEERNFVHQSKSISELDHNLNNVGSRAKRSSTRHGELEIFVIDKMLMVGPKFSLGNYRQAYIINDVDSRKLARDVIAVARKVSQVDFLQKQNISPFSYLPPKQMDKDQMRYLRSLTSFDIAFSLIVPEPQVLDVFWDVKTAVKAYVKPLLEELSMLFKVNVKSQVLYMTSLPIQSSHGAVTADHLPSIINPIEARLGSDTSLNPNINFVVYVPTRQQAPLLIHDTKGLQVPANAFLVPQWGGVLIYNPPDVPENASLPYEVVLDPKLIMETFLTQLRLLLGLPELGDIGGEPLSILPTHGIRKWEIDFLLRKNAQEQLSFAISSLSSLSQLLQTIGNIVIRDDVGKKIHYALHSSKESLRLLGGGHLMEGFRRTKSAFMASEEAFFDPSLLALLYFPDDQKYAIYIPLFLPVGIPVVTSMFHIWKFWWDCKQSKEKSD